MVRDGIVAEFETMQAAGSGRVQEFDISLRWLTETETKRASTYCIIVTDEQRTSHTLHDDAYQLSGVIVLYAQDTRDARAKIDLMLEDAIEVLRRAFHGMASVLQKASVESITTSEGSTAEAYWTQGVIRWSGVHRRAVMV